MWDFPVATAAQTPLAGRASPASMPEKEMAAPLPLIWANRTQSDASLDQHKSPGGDLVYQNFTDATLGLHPEESEQLQKIFDDYQVIHTQASGLRHLENWLDLLKERLTASIEKLGDYYPEYRISLIAADEANAFVYKYRPTGQKYYRGHVYVSTGLLCKMAATILDKQDAAEVSAADILQMNPGQMDMLFNGLQGILAHEFSHPKEDELIKWEWREAKDKSWQSHGQADEAATDLVALKVLKEAKLAPSNMLLGLQLLFGHEFPTGPAFQRGANAFLSTHPEDKLRLNIVRGGLVKLRHDEGKTEIEVLPYDSKALRGEMARLLSQITPEDQAARILKFAQETDQSPILIFAQESLTRLQKRTKQFHPGGEKFPEFLNDMEILQQLWESLPCLDPDNEERLVSWFDQIFQMGKVRFYTGLWTVNRAGYGGIDPFHYPIAGVRRAQKIYEKHPLFQNQAWQRWLKNKCDVSFWQFFDKANYLPVMLPREQVFFIYRQASTRLKEREENSRSKLLLEMIYGLLLSGGETARLHQDILETLDELLPASEEAVATVARNLHNVFYDYSSSPSRPDWFEPLSSPQILNSWASVFWKIFSQWPQFFLEDFSLGSDLNGHYINHKNNNWWWEILQWNLSRELGKHFMASHHQDTEALSSQVLDVMGNSVWQPFLHQAFIALAEKTGNEFQNNLVSGYFGFRFLIARDNLPFTSKQRTAILETMLKPANGASADSALFKGSLLFETAVLQLINVDQKSFLLERALAMVERIRAAGRNDVLAYLEEVFGDAKKLSKALFKNGDTLVVVLDDWKKRGILDDQAWHAAMERYVYAIRPSDSISPLESLNKSGAYLLWNKAQASGPKAVMDFLTKIAKSHPVETAGIEFKTDETRKLQLAGIRTMPDYARVASFIRQGLGNDFRRLLGLNRHDGPEKFSAALDEHYEDAREFMRVIFNPDGQIIPLRLRGLANFHHLDGPAETVFGSIPTGALDARRSLELWQLASAKRANRHTDAFFEKDVLPHLESLPQEDKLSTFSEILENGRLRSERLKNHLMETLLEKTLQDLDPPAGKLVDRDLRPIFDRVGSLIPDGSRFRDDLIEKIAWKLELSESQTLKFVEPMKSFSFRTMNPLTINLLSGLSVALGKLKQNEKLALVRHFRSPSGSVRDAVPRLEKISREIDDFLRQCNVKNFDWMDHLDGFVRDAGEGDRLVLIELLVGTPGYGLWYTDDSTREQLFNLASLEKGSEKRKLFDSYLKALPVHEHSTTLSYLIATQTEGSGGSELLRILETFDAPGIKFAQMASILGIFGPERSEELATAKDRAQTPSRALVYKTLKEALPPEDFAKIRHVRRLLGSGSIKFVVLLEYEDGSIHAASLRRPFLDERIASTMEIAAVWSQDLLQDAEFARDYDFDHYLDYLKHQLAAEVDFERELQLAQSMMKKYLKFPSHGGWKFQAVLPSPEKTQNTRIMHFKAIENAVPFEKLTPQDKIAAAELIVGAELHLLLDQGSFDADRHLGNFLFDPGSKTVYPIDMGQAYTLSPNKLFTPGDRYAVAEWLYGITAKDPAAGAETLTRVFLRLAESRGEAPSDLPPLFEDIKNALSQEGDIKQKTLRVLAELNRRHIRLPLRFTMGVVKGLTIVMNEKYARELPEEYITSKIRSFVKSQLLWGSRFKIWGHFKKNPAPLEDEVPDGAIQNPFKKPIQ